MMYEYELQTVSIRVSAPPAEDTPVLGDPAVVGEFLLDLFKTLDQDQEHVILLALDGRHRLNGYKVISSGTGTHSLVDPARFFRIGLRLDATGLIIAHNHPNGKMEASRDDIRLTRSLVRGGELIALPVHDHIIIGHGEWLSLRRSRPGLFTGAPA